MRKVIWKYPLDATDYQRIAMPIGAQILSVQVQKDQPCMWALVNSDEPTEARAFHVAATGQPIDINAELNFIGSFQLHGGSLVFHLFEVKGI